MKTRRGWIGKTLFLSAVAMAGALFFATPEKADAATLDWDKVFDAGYYLEVNPDLKAAFGDDINKAFSHFQNYGMREGRESSPNFSMKSYFNEYPDLRRAFSRDNVRYYVHYIQNGFAEGRHGKGSENNFVGEYEKTDGTVSAVYDEKTGNINMVADEFDLYDPDSIVFAVWGEAQGQNDIKWIGAKKNADGTYSASTNYIAHNKELGPYQVHAYVLFNDNTKAFVTNAVAEVGPLYMDTLAQQKASKTGNLIMVDEVNNIMGVYSGSQGNWKSVLKSLCATGKNGATPKGEFETGVKGRSFNDKENKSYTCYWFTGFIGSQYLFHSTLYKINTMEPLNSRVGASLSHGCIRLPIDIAKWLYDNVPKGTKVVIYR